MRANAGRSSHRPRPLPPGPWAISQRWNDLLFAHWPVRAASIDSLLPDELIADTFHGSAWIGVLPYWMDKMRLRGLPGIPGAREFPELNLRTYVRDRQTGAPGIYILSLDAGSLLTVMFARSLYHLPYHWAQMNMQPRGDREFSFYSRRLLSGKPVRFAARYRGLGPTRKLAHSRPGSIEYFLTERHCLFTRDALGRLMRANVHFIPSPLEDAEADIERNELPSALGLSLADSEPLLHYSRRLAIYVWTAEPAHAKALPANPAVAAAQFDHPAGTVSL